MTGTQSLVARELALTVSCPHCPACINPEHLEPVTHMENLRRGRGTKVTEAQANEVRRLRAQGLFVRVCAEQVGITEDQAWSIVKNRSWRI